VGALLGDIKGNVGEFGGSGMGNNIKFESFKASQTSLFIQKNKMTIFC